MKPNRILSIFLSCLLILSLAVPALAEQNPDCGAKLIAITFDDGPAAGYTRDVLNTLRYHGASGTFPSGLSYTWKSMGDMTPSRRCQYS